MKREINRYDRDLFCIATGSQLSAIGLIPGMKFWTIADVKFPYDMIRNKV